MAEMVTKLATSGELVFSNPTEAVLCRRKRWVVNNNCTAPQRRGLAVRRGGGCTSKDAAAKAAHNTTHAKAAGGSLEAKAGGTGQ